MGSEKKGVPLVFFLYFPALFFSKGDFCASPFSALVFFFLPALFFLKGYFVLFFIANSMILLILHSFPDFFFFNICPWAALFFFLEIALFFSKGAFLGRPFFALFFFLALDSHRPSIHYGSEMLLIKYVV